METACPWLIVSLNAVVMFPNKNPSLFLKKKNKKTTLDLQKISSEEVSTLLGSGPRSRAVAEQMLGDLWLRLWGPGRAVGGQAGSREALAAGRGKWRGKC